MPFFYVGCTALSIALACCYAWKCRSLKQALAEAKSDPSPLLTQILSELPALVSWIDTDFQFKFFNAGFERWFGPQARTGTGWDLTKVFGDEQADTIRRHRELARNGIDSRVQLSFTRVDGANRIVDVNYHPLKDEKGKVHGIIVVVFDVTDRVEGEERIRASEAKLKRVLQDGRLGYWESDLKNVSWSENNYALLGLPFGIPITQEFFHSRVHPDDFPRIMRARDELAKKGVPYEVEFRLRHEDGSYRWVFNTVNPVLDSEGKLVRLAGITADVTSKKETEQMMEAQKAQMVFASRMASLGEMAAGVAHEINNPLAIIGGRAQQLVNRLNLGDEVPVEELKKHLLTIDGTVARIASIVKGLRAFARDGEGDPFQKVPVSTLINDTVSFCKSRFAHQNIDLQVDDQTRGALIECRATQIGQIILNLLNNSFDAVEGASERWIRLIARPHDGGFEFQITDSGKGIPQEVRDKIFQPFFTTKAVGKGTGLGLSIASGIVKSHRGRLEILEISPAHPNTTFVVWLPALQKAERFATVH